MTAFSFVLKIGYRFARSKTVQFYTPPQEYLRDVVIGTDTGSLLLPLGNLARRRFLWPSDQESTTKAPARSGVI